MTVFFSPPSKYNFKSTESKKIDRTKELFQVCLIGINFGVLRKKIYYGTKNFTETIVKSIGAKIYACIIKDSLKKFIYCRKASLNESYTRKKIVFWV